jgi:hypothetical protein
VTEGEGLLQLGVLRHKVEAVQRAESESLTEKVVLEVCVHCTRSHERGKIRGMRSTASETRTGQAWASTRISRSKRCFVG